MFTDYMENKLVDFLFRGQTYTPPTSWYFALFTANANDAGGSLVEVTGGSYARSEIVSNLTNWAGTQAAGSTTASTGSSATTSNNVTIPFPAPTANWGSIVGIGIYDAASGGNLCLYGELTTPKTVNNNDPAPLFPIGAFLATVDS